MVTITEKYGDEIIELYTKEGLSIREIGALFGVSQTPIRKTLKINNIPLRKSGEGLRIKKLRDRLEKGIPIKEAINKFENGIINDYINGLSSRQIATKFNFNQRSVLNILKKNGVIRRKDGSPPQYNHLFNEINELYLEGKSTVFIGKLFGIDPNSVIRLLKSNGVKIRPHKEATKLNSGPNHPAWKGGISYGDYCSKFNDEFKERVRTFWNRKCGICGKEEKYNLKSGGRLDVHHVNYDKKVCCNNTPPLFIPLCKSCHTRTMHKRDSWESNLTNYIMTYFDGESYERRRGR